MIPKKKKKNEINVYFIGVTSLTKNSSVVKVKIRVLKNREFA